MPTASAVAVLRYKKVKRLSVPTTPARTTTPRASSVTWFVPGAHVSQFPHPAGGKSLAHVALDLAGVAAGSPIYEPVGGRVTKVERLNVRPSFGMNVRVLTSAGVEEVFAHLSEVDVKPGDVLSRGQFLGRVGNSGTEAVHLHYEVRQPGADVFDRQWSTTSALDPVAFLQTSKPVALVAAPAISSGPAIASKLQTLRASSSATTSTGKVTAKATVTTAPATGIGKITGTATATPAPKERTLLKTPIGNVTLPAIHWWNVFGFILGSVLIVIALASFVRAGALQVEKGAQGATATVERVGKTQVQLAKLAAMLA